MTIKPLKLRFFHQLRGGLFKWRHRFTTMVRYRLLILAAAPLAVTLMAVILAMLYFRVSTTLQMTQQTLEHKIVLAQQFIDEFEGEVSQAPDSEFYKRLTSLVFPATAKLASPNAIESSLNDTSLSSFSILEPHLQGEVWDPQSWSVSAVLSSSNQTYATPYITLSLALWPKLKIDLIEILQLSLFALGLVIVLAAFIYRSARNLFRPIERIHRVVKLVQLGKDVRIGRLNLDQEHELALLAKQFDHMLDLLDQRNHELESAALQLEAKVQSRTESLRDKTQLLETHIELLNQTRDKLIINEKLAALGELTAGIAHEINNPAAVILGNVELIEFALGSRSEDVKDEIQAILLQIDRIRNITRSLLQYSRQGGMQDQITWQHLTPIINESITLVKTGAKKREVQFVTQFNATEAVEINRHHLLQVMVNLMMNGIHAMDGNGVLTIISEDWRVDGINIGAIIRIQDQGAGIKPEFINKIFSPFFTTKRSGTGLGLSVSQSLLSQNGGEIKVSSQLGIGSEFSIYLPAKASQGLLVKA